MIQGARWLRPQVSRLGAAIMDVQAAAAERENGPRRGRQRWAMPGRREVEGSGGRFWYELGF